MPLHAFVAAMLAKQKEAGAPALSAGTPAAARVLVAAGRAETLGRELAARSGCAVLRSEGEAYAEALSAAGAKVTTRRYTGVAHGFLRLHNHFDTAQEAVLDIAAAIAEAARTAQRTQ